MSEIELKPCPFCGGEADEKGVLHGDGRTSPECMKCGATAESIKLWNTRADGWISVSELLPYADFEVLVCCDDDVFVDVMRSGYVDGDFWFECERDCGRKVTHWLPLPQPPTKKGD